MDSLLAVKQQQQRWTHDNTELEHSHWGQAMLWARRLMLPPQSVKSARVTSLLTMKSSRSEGKWVKQERCEGNATVNVLLTVVVMPAVRHILSVVFVCRRKKRESPPVLEGEKQSAGLNFSLLKNTNQTRIKQLKQPTCLRERQKTPERDYWLVQAVSLASSAIEKTTEAKQFHFRGKNTGAWHLIFLLYKTNRKQQKHPCENYHC